jgi:uncharacterized membrane protein YqjE
MASPFDAVRRLSVATVNLLLLRAEFASLELAQARAQIMRWFALALAAMTLVLLALIAASALFIVLAWPRLDWGALLLLGLAYALGAVLVMRRLQREMVEAPPLLAETLAELKQDRDAFVGRDPAAGDPRGGSETRESP